MMGDKQNILLVVPGLEMGGAQSNLLRLASEFHHQGRRVTILDLKPFQRNREYVESLLEPEIPIYSPPFFLRNNRKSGPGFFEKRDKLIRGFLKMKPESSWLKTFVRRNNFGAVHSHMYLADLYLSRNLGSDRKRFVRLSKQCGCYNLIEAQVAKEDKHKFFEQVSNIFSSIDGVVTMTAQHEEFLTRHDLSIRTKRIYNGIRIPESTPPEESNTLRCIMCARDEPSKGWEAAIVGTIGARKQGITVHLDLLGDGPHLKELQQKYTGSEGVTFLGSQTDPMSLLSSYDIGLLPSTFKAESLPNTIVEYQASGLATIGTAIGEIPHLLSADGQNAGVLITPGAQENMGRQITSALSLYSTVPSALRQHKHGATVLRRRFDIEATAGAYLTFSESLQSTS